MVIDKKGNMTDIAGKYKGRSMLEARKEILKDELNFKNKQALLNKIWTIEPVDSYENLFWEIGYLYALLEVKRLLKEGLKN